MPRTNSFTADAATQTAPNLGRPLFLIGIFSDPAGAAALVRTQTGTIVRLEQDIPQDGLRLISVGDGWALLSVDDQIHRLPIA